MSTMLPDTHDETETPHPTPSAWSVPRPDGPLAGALREAEAQRLRAAVPETPAQGSWEEPLPIDLLPLPAAARPPAESMAQDIAALAREASAHDGEREALAIALEWPAEGAPPLPEERAVRPWLGWTTLAGALVLAVAAAAIALSLAPRDAPPLRKPASDTLKMERQLSLPRTAHGAGAGP